MPTGYTHDLTESTTLRDFAINCARAFICHDTIAEALAGEPSVFCAERVAKAEAKLADVRAMSEEDARRFVAGRYEADLAEAREANARDERRCDVYRRLRDQAVAWKPPTPEHERFRRFMIEQLDVSIGNDGPLELPPPPDLDNARSCLVIEAQRELSWALATLADETERVARRRRWAEALVAAFPASAQPEGGAA